MRLERERSSAGLEIQFIVTEVQKTCRYVCLFTWVRKLSKAFTFCKDFHVCFLKDYKLTWKLVEEKRPEGKLTCSSYFQAQAAAQVPYVHKAKSRKHLLQCLSRSGALACTTSVNSSDSDLTRLEISLVESKQHRKSCQAQAPGCRRACRIRLPFTEC